MVPKRRRSAGGQQRREATLLDAPLQRLVGVPLIARVIQYVHRTL
jgi:hypothetical protein